jgi:phage shock protein A
MRLLDRIGLLIKADAHGVIESIEDRRLLAKQHLREAKLALDAKRAHIAELRNDQQRLTLDGKRLAALSARANDDVDLALRGDQDDLARAAIRRLLPLREAERRVGARLHALREEESRLAERLAIQEHELEILRTRVQADLATLECGDALDDPFESRTITDDDVDIELLRRRQSLSPSSEAPRREAER